MAIEKIITIKADTDDAVKGIEDVTDALKDVDKQSDKTEKSVGDIGKTAKKQTGAVKGLGNAFKAIGIGLIIALVASLTEVLSKNKKVVDFVNTAFTTVSIVLNKVFDVIGDVVGKISEATGGFDAFGKVVGGIITLVLTPLKLTFYGITLAIQEAQLIWENSFFGGKDPETIKELNKKILETKENLIEVVDTAIEAGGKITDNFIEAVGEFGTAISVISKDGIEGIKDISIKASIEQAKAITSARNNFELLALTQDRLMLQYQNEAELLRQTRDDETKSITDRIQANNELKEVLNKQFEAEQKSIKQRIASLHQEQKLLGVTVERTNEIFQLQTDLIDVEERLQGQRSEQLVNNNALLKEQIELNQTISDAEKERQLAQLEFDATQEEKEIKKLDLKREQLELENEIIAEDLERKKLLYAEGTQARVDAEQEYLTKKDAIDNQLIANEKATNEQKLKDDKIVNDTKFELAKKAGNLIGLLSKKNSKINKITSAATALINTYQGITAELATKTATPFEFGIKLTNIATTALIGFKSVKDILSTNDSGSPSAPSGAVTGGASAPSFNLVQGTGSNQIAEGLAEQDQPIQAFVVSGDVTTSQELDRNIIENGSL